MQTALEKHLTCTTNARTLSLVNRTIRQMDATAKKLVEKMREIQRQIGSLQRQSYALESTLDAIGMRIEDDVPWEDSWDIKYAKNSPFASTTLVATCKNLLVDHAGKELTKSQVEYLAAIGGYKFDAEDSKNSVDVTLRRLAEGGFCDVGRQRGPEGNKYSYPRVGLYILYL